HEAPQVLLVGPEEISLVGALAEANGLGTCPIAGDKNNVVSIDRSCNRHTIHDLIRDAPQHLSGTRGDSQDMLGSPGDQLLAGWRINNHGRGIPGRIIRGAPYLLAVDAIEGHEASTLRTRMRDHQVFPDDRRSRQAPRGEFRLEPGDAVLRPQARAR